MTLREFSVGPTGTYLTLQALESAMDGVAVSEDIVRGVLQDGDHPSTVSFGGWTSGVAFEIVAENSGLATISGQIFVSGSTSPDSTLIDGVVLQGHETLYFTPSVNHTLTVKNCVWDADGITGFNEVVRTKPTAGTLTMVFENVVAYNFGATTARATRLEFSGTADLDITFKGYTQRGGTLKIYSGGPVSMSGSVLKLDGALDADSNAEWTMVETITNQTSPGWSTQTDCTFGVTINDSGNPASGEVSFTDGAAYDLTLVDHVNNIALNYWATTPLATDITGATRGSPADAGAYEVVSSTGRTLDVDVGAFVTTFQNVALTHDTGIYTLDVDVGAFATTFQDVLLVYDLNAPASRAPYGGDKVNGITAIAPDIHASRTSGEASFVLQVTAANTTASGSSHPFDELYYEWDFGDTDSASITANAMTNPVTGIAVDPNVDQNGPNATYPYRAAGSYTVTLKVWAANAAGDITAYATTTQAITVTAWSGSDMYFDSVAGDDTYSGTLLAPRQSYAKIKEWLIGGSSRRALIKRGSTITIDSQLRLKRDRQWIGAYGTGAKPRIECEAGGYINVDGSYGGDNLDVVIQDIVLDGMGEQATVMIFNGNNGNDGNPELPNGHWHTIDCTFLNTGATVAFNNAFITGTCYDTNDTSWWNCDFDVDEQGDLIIFYSQEPTGVSATSTEAPCEFLSITGGSFAGGDADIIRDHHVYLSGYNKYRTTRWIEHKASTLQSFCQNQNCSNYVDHDSEFTLIDSCLMRGTNHGVDLSNGFNNPALGKFDNSIIQNCDFHIGQIPPVPPSTFYLGSCFYGYCTKRTVIRDNTGWGNPVSEFAIEDADAVIMCYRNKFWHDRGTLDSTRIQLFAGQTGKFVDNEWQILGTGTVQIIGAPTTVLAAFDWDGNNWRNEESVVLAYDETTTSNLSLATWQSTYEANAVSVDPGWNDPANGDFSVGTYELEVSAAAFTTTFVDVVLTYTQGLMTAAWNTSKVDYFRESRPFINLIHYGADHISRTSGGTHDTRAVSADANGYVTSLLLDQEAGYPMCAGATGGVSGSYILTFDGDVGLDIEGGTSVVEVSTGRWTFEWDGTTALYLWIESITTKATNIKVFYKDNESSIQDGELFTPEYLAQMNDTAGVRAMEWSRINNSNLTTTFRAQSYVFWGGADGVPPAVCVALANRLDCDLWFCVPHKATNAFVTALAPVLDACDNTVFVEYSNETWNGTKSQSTYCTEQGSALATGVRLQNLYFQAKRSIEVWSLLDAAGLEAGTKMLRVMASQAADSTRMSDIMAYNSGEALPVTDIISCAPYIGGLTLSTNSLAVQALTNAEYFAAKQTDLTTALGWVQDYIDLDLGKQIRLYEAGQHDGVADTGNDAALDAYLEARQNDPLMATLYTNYLDGLQSKGVAETYLYNLDQEWTDQYWGSFDGGTFGTHTNYQKWLAVEAWRGRPATATLTTSMFAPTVAITAHIVATPTTVALTTTGGISQTDVSDHQSFTPGIASLTTSGKLPSVAITAIQNLTPASSQLIITGFAPSTGLLPLGVYEVMHNRIRSRFNNQIVATEVATSVVYDNEMEVPPSDTSWVQCSIRDTDTELVGFGGKLTYRKRGFLRAVVHGPLGQGDGLSLRICDAVRVAFNRVSDGAIRYGITSTGGYNRADQSWEMVTETPFYSDDIANREANVGSWSLLDREAAFNSVRSRFDTLFGRTGSISTNTVVYDNAPTKPPTDTQWINFSINTGTTEIVGAGAGAWVRTVGTATAMIMSPLGTGNKAPLELADTIVQKFRAITDTGVIYETPSLLTVGRRNQWWQTNCNIRYRLEEVAQ